MDETRPDRSSLKEDYKKTLPPEDQLNMFHGRSLTNCIQVETVLERVPYSFSFLTTDCEESTIH